MRARAIVCAHARTRVYECVYVCVFARACVRVCLNVWVWVCVRVCVCVFARARAYVWRASGYWARASETALMMMGM